MANVKESLKLFSRDLINLFDGNKDIVEISKTISKIEFKLKEINDSSEVLKEIDETVISLDKEMEKEKQKNQNIKEEIEGIKKSKGYLKNLELKKKIKLLEDELEKDIFQLKQLIDFKSLGGINVTTLKRRKV